MRTFFKLNSKGQSLESFFSRAKNAQNNKNNKLAASTKMFWYCKISVNFMLERIRASSTKNWSYLTFRFSALCKWVLKYIFTWKSPKIFLDSCLAVIYNYNENELVPIILNKPAKIIINWIGTIFNCCFTPMTQREETLWDGCLGSSFTAPPNGRGIKLNFVNYSPGINFW